MNNIESIVIEYLANKLEVPVYKDVPKDRPNTFVTVENTGGFVDNSIETANVAIQNWSDTEYNASELSILVAETLAQAPYFVSKILHVNNNLPYSYSDGSGHRYQFISEIKTI